MNDFAQVFVPATADGLHAVTVRSILRQGHAARVMPMLHTEGYFRLLLALWADAQSFVIVEHDMELHGDELEGFALCPEPWCAHSYEVFAGDLATAYGGPYGLGCVRFRRELLEAHPEAVEEAGRRNEHPVHPPRSYAVMDSTLTGYLRACGYEAHLHEPAVGHHHAYLRDGAFIP